MPTSQPIESPIPPIVPLAVAANLYAHLREQGRQHGSVQDLSLLIGTAAERAWGTPRAKRFQDANGGGWLVDLSQSMDGEELYAIVRSLGGGRTIAAVVEADEVEAFSKSGTWRTPTALLGEADEPLSVDGVGHGPDHPLPAAIATATASPRRAPQTDADPVLVVYWAAGASRPTHEAQIRLCSRGEAATVIQALMRDGFHEDGEHFPVEADTIEVWSQMSKPKLEIKF